MNLLDVGAGGSLTLSARGGKGLWGKQQMGVWGQSLYSSSAIRLIAWSISTSVVILPTERRRVPAA